MSPNQQLHLDSLVASFESLVRPKYEAGAKEHGGTLSDMPVRDLLVNAREEVIDMFVYLQTAIEKLDTESK